MGAFGLASEGVVTFGEHFFQETEDNVSDRLRHKTHVNSRRRGFDSHIERSFGELFELPLELQLHQPPFSIKIRAIDLILRIRFDLKDTSTDEEVVFNRDSGPPVRINLLLVVRRCIHNEERKLGSRGRPKHHFLVFVLILIDFDLYQRELSSKALAKGNFASAVLRGHLLARLSFRRLLFRSLCAQFFQSLDLGGQFFEVGLMLAVRGDMVDDHNN